MAKKTVCPVCYKLETRREIDDCIEARDWARSEIEANEGSYNGNIYNDMDIARPRGSNGTYADDNSIEYVD